MTNARQEILPPETLTASYRNPDELLDRIGELLSEALGDGVICNAATLELQSATGGIASINWKRST